MIHLKVQVIGTEQQTGSERILSVVESSHYDPDYLEGIINTAITKALGSIKSINLSDLRPWSPEVSVALTVDDERVRPSIHLSHSTLIKLTEGGCAFDFDPYI